MEWSLAREESGLTGYIGLSTLTTLKDSFKLTRLLQHFLSPGGGGLGEGEEVSLQIKALPKIHVWLSRQQQEREIIPSISYKCRRPSQRFYFNLTKLADSPATQEISWLRFAFNQLPSAWEGWSIAFCLALV